MFERAISLILGGSAYDVPKVLQRICRRSNLVDAENRATKVSTGNA
jgi:hypothetical protein